VPKKDNAKTTLWMSAADRKAVKKIMKRFNFDFSNAMRFAAHFAANVLDRIEDAAAGAMRQDAPIKNDQGESTE